MPWREVSGGYTKKTKSGRGGGFVKNPAQYEKLKAKYGKERAAKITNASKSFEVDKSFAQRHSHDTLENLDRKSSKNRRKSRGYGQGTATAVNVATIPLVHDALNREGGNTTGRQLNRVGASFKTKSPKAVGRAIAHNPKVAILAGGTAAATGLGSKAIYHGVRSHQFERAAFNRRKARGPITKSIPSTLMMVQTSGFERSDADLVRLEEIDKAWGKRMRTSTEHLTTEATRAASAGRGAAHSVHTAADEASTTIRQVRALLPKNRWAAAGTATGLAVAAGAPSGVGAYLGNRRRNSVAKAFPPAGQQPQRPRSSLGQKTGALASAGVLGGGLGATTGGLRMESAGRANAASAGQVGRMARTHLRVLQQNPKRFAGGGMFSNPHLMRPGPGAVKELQAASQQSRTDVKAAHGVIRTARKIRTGGKIGMAAGGLGVLGSAASMNRRQQ